MHSVTHPETGEVIEMTDLKYRETCEKVLADWEQSKKLLEEAKDKEMKLRKQYVALASDPNREKGTENIALGNGYKAKVVKKITHTFIKGPDDKVDWDAVMKAQDEIEKVGNEGAFLAERLLKWEAKFVLSEYNKLEASNDTHAAVKKIMDRVLVTKEAAPTLDIVAPKS